VEQEIHVLPVHLNAVVSLINENDRHEITNILLKVLVFF
jgi:hypothetical protein